MCVCQVDAIHRKEAMKLMTEMFYAALFGYDEVIIRSLALSLAPTTKVFETPENVGRFRLYTETVCV